MRHNLFADQCAAEAFDEIQRGRYLVGSIHGDVNYRMLFEGCQRHANLLGKAARFLGCRNAGDLQSCGHPCAQLAYEMHNGGPGPQTDDHPAVDFIESGDRGLSFECIRHRSCRKHYAPLRFVGVRRFPFPLALRKASTCFSCLRNLPPGFRRMRDVRRGIGGRMCPFKYASMSVG